ncbi:MAG: DUF5675 family protein [Paludibacteraceae bacterium]|nr:DUF5675 family protein [Paludibacteraceae bacterium]
MYLKLIRNAPQGSAITGRLVIDGRYFCNTLERVGYQIPALCYPVRVTHSPKFKRLLPIVQNVPQRTGIRFHVGKVPKHSTGCILTLADNASSPERPRELIGAQVVEKNVVEVVDSNNPVVGCRSAADVESQLTQLLLQAQNDHEEILLEVTDFRPGTEYGYNTLCPSSECAREKEIRSANFARRHSYLAGARTIVSSSILEPTRLSDGY